MILDILKRKMYFFVQKRIEDYRKKYICEDSSRIYMFHNISDRSTNPKEFNCNVHDFKEFIIKQKLKPKSVLDILEYREGYYALTFDDVHKGVYNYAIPILEEFQVPYTLFVATNLLDKEGYLTTEDLKKISSNDLCTIGSHTVSHSLLRFDKNSEHEVSKSKDILEKLLKKKIELFAYPYGSIYACSNKNIKEVKKSGYRYALSAVPGTLSERALKKPFFLPRINGDIVVKEGD